MTLSNDVERCVGYYMQHPTFYGKTEVGRVDCVRCQRRIIVGEIRIEEVKIMDKPNFINGECPQRIGPGEQRHDC